MFRTYLSPILIIIVYWLFVVMSIGYGVTTILFFAATGSAVLILLGIVVGVIVIILGLIFSRISCEMMMIQFRIHEQLKELNEKQK